MLSNLFSGVLSHLITQVEVKTEPSKEAVIGDDVVAVICCTYESVCAQTLNWLNWTVEFLFSMAMLCCTTPATNANTHHMELVTFRLLAFLFASCPRHLPPQPAWTVLVYRSSSFVAARMETSLPPPGRITHFSGINPSAQSVLNYDIYLFFKTDTNLQLHLFMMAQSVKVQPSDNCDMLI